KIEKDKILDFVKTEPKQFQLVLISIISLEERAKLNEIFTGDIYNQYHLFCERTKTDVLTQRRVSDILKEFDMVGIINSSVVSKGRQGRTSKIKLSISKQLLPKVKEILNDSLNL
ncbi:MAG: cell division control protein Cdc6, partial [Nanoarchaeota archaeon]